MAEFLMTLSANDVNMVRQEAYVLIPISARQRRPSFWDWPGRYSLLPTGQTEMHISLDDLGVATTSRVYDVPERSEFRLCTDVYRLGDAYEGCILRVERIGSGSYSTSVVCPGDGDWNACYQSLTDTTPSGTKSWGYR
jgi:hypothetical protein